MNTLIPLDVFSPVSKVVKQNTAPYIFTKHSRSDTYYFGCVRKIYNNGRIDGNKGAVGTDQKYWGKWTCPGGGIDTRHHFLHAVIDEINHEANTNFNHTQVDVSNLDKKYPKPKDSKFICHYAVMNTTINTAMFILEMHENDFFNIFPLGGNYCETLCKTSQGELDSIQAFSLDDINYYQNKEVTNKNNNYFISYFLSSLTNIILPKMITMYPDILNITPTIKKLSDIDSRMPTEFIHKSYSTTPGPHVPTPPPHVPTPPPHVPTPPPHVPTPPPHVPLHIKIIGSHYNKDDPNTDFKKMIVQPEYENTLFIFNDNVRDHVTNESGGGNAYIRKYNKYRTDDKKPQSAGISTGPGTTGLGFPSLDLTTKNVIDGEIQEIKNLIKRYKYNTVIWSQNKHTGKLGVAIFNPHQDVIDYITTQIINLDK